MRYLVQFLVPALIILAVVYLLVRTKRGQDEASEQEGNAAGSSDTGTFILILVVGATVAILSFFALQAALG